MFHNDGIVSTFLFTKRGLSFEIGDAGQNYWMIHFRKKYCACLIHRTRSSTEDRFSS